MKNKSALRAALLVTLVLTSFAFAAAQPSITTTGSLTAFTSIAGSPSLEQNYTVSGTNLTADITVTAPADFEVSLTSGSGFAASVNVTQTGGTVTDVPIYVRFNRAAAGTSSGSVTNASTGATTANVPVSGTANNPAPTTTSINPTTKTAGDPQFDLTINGTNFVAGSVVQFNGSDRLTSFVSSTQLTATILASDLLASGSFTIAVFNPTPGGGLSNSQTLTVDPGALNHFLVEQQGGGAIGTQTAGTPFNIRITAQDANNNTVTSFAGTVTLTSNGGLVGSPLTSGSFVAGVLASQQVTLDAAGASRTITATAGVSGTSDGFTVNPGPLHHFVVEAAGGGAIPAQIAGTPFNIRVTAQDILGNTQTAFTGTVDISSTGILSSGSGTTVQFVAGVLSSHSVTISNTGAFTVTAVRTGGSETGTSNSFNVGSAAAAQLVYVTAPGNAIAGAVIAPAVTVQLRDQFGNNVAVGGVSVSVSLNSGSGTLNGTLTRNTNGSGVATFNNLSVDLSGPKTLRASSGSLTPADASFFVSPAAASVLAFITSPGTSVAGAAFVPEPVVVLRDAHGNTVTGTTQTVTVAIQNNAGPGGVLSGTTSVGVDTATGLATFANLSIDRVGTGYTLTATGSTVSTVPGAVVSEAFNITPGVRKKLAFIQQPTTTAAGAFISPAVSVQLQDSLGNGVSDSGVAVTLAVDAGTLGGVVTQQTGTGGIAVFNNLHIEVPGTKQLTATSPGLNSAVSTTFTITPAAASKLAFTVNPGDGVAGLPLSTQPVVTLQDAYGNTVLGTAQNVTIALRDTAGRGAALSGTLIVPVNTSTGQAVFTGLSVNKTGTGYMLQAVGSTIDTVPGAVVSTSFAVTPGAPTKVRVETAADGSGTLVGHQNVSSGTTIEVFAVSRDALDNFVANVQADVAGWQLLDVSGGILPTDLVASADRRSATFTARLVGSARIRATSGTLTAVPTDTIHVVVAGTPASILVETAANGTGTIVPAQTLTSGNSILLYSIARDAAGNFVSNISADVWQLRDTTAGVRSTDLVPAPDRKSAALTAHRVGTGRVEALSGTLVSTGTGVLTVRAGAPASVAATGGTPQSARVNTAFAAPLRSTVYDAAGNTVSGIAVTFSAPASGPSGAFAAGSATRTTDSTGVATAPGFTANTVAGAYHDTAKVTGIAAPALFALTNTAGVPAVIAATAGTPQSAQVSTAFPDAFQVAVHDSFGNPVSNALVKFIAPATGASGSFVAGRDTAVTDASGKATASIFVANVFAGSYTVTANTLPQLPAPAQFALTNTAGPVGSIAASAGTPQSAEVNTAFAIQLAAIVKDATGNPVGGVPVTFRAPSSGAAGTFVSGSLSDTVQTNVQGIALAHVFKANTIAGSYSVVATAPGVGASAPFALTNVAAALDTFLVEAEAGGVIGTQVVGQPTKIRVTAHDMYGNTVTTFTGTVTISATGVLQSGGGTTPAFSGGVLASYSVTTGAAGSYRIIATRTGGAETGRSNSFVVNNPVPTLLSVTPSNGRAGQSLTVVVKGHGFLSGVTSVFFGDRITTLATAVNSDSQLTVNLHIDTSAQVGPRTVTVINAPPGGSSSLVGGFIVGDNPIPTLVSLVPAAGNQLQTLDIAVRGSNFLGGVTTVSFGSGITVNSVTVDSATHLTANISIGAAAALGSRNVVVTNGPPGGGSSAPLSFTVNAAGLTVPVLLSPANGAKSQPSTLTLRWGKVFNASTYWVQVSPNAGFSTLTVNDSTVTDTVRQVGPLQSPATYYWRVRSRNSTGASSFSPAWSFSPTYLATVTIAANVAFPVRATPGDYLPTDYRLVGLPGASDTAVTAFLPGAAGTDWQMYWDTGADANYLLKYDGSPTFQFAPGRGFWLIKVGPWSVNATVPSIVIDTNSVASISLHAGWNLITNPFLAAVSWASVQAANGNLPEPIYGFTGSFSQSLNMTAYAGYLFDNRGNLALLRIPSSGAPAKILAANDSLSWQVKIGMTSGHFVEEGISFGVNPQAAEGLDRLDFRKPRAIGEIPSVQFDRPEWERTNAVYASDVRPEVKEKERWDFNVVTRSREAVRLTFEGVQRVPEHLEVYLVDATRGTSVNLRGSAGAEYVFTPATDRSSLAVVVGTKEAIRRDLEAAVPRDFALDMSYPNPFNPSTTIPVAVPFRTDVRVIIYNVLGEEIKTVFAGPLEPGRYFFTWNGNSNRGSNVASGMYVVTMSTATGKRFAHKVLLLK